MILLLKELCDKCQRLSDISTTKTRIFKENVCSMKGRTVLNTTCNRNVRVQQDNLI